MVESVTAADCRLLLSLLKFAIVDPAQRERVEAWLEAKKARLECAKLGSLAFYAGDSRVIYC